MASTSSSSESDLGESSTSSFSSSSSSSSSQSSLTSLSTSSTSNSSSSSSSSIDSSSTSSESIGNFSSSSSSFAHPWNKTKPLIMAMSSVNSITIFNRLAQTVFLREPTYAIGSVSCYLYGPYGDSNAFTLNLGIYDCNDDGTPKTLLGSSTILGSSITKANWYSFTIALNGSTPANGYLSFVLWQTSGNEDSCALWGYNSTSDVGNTKAWFSDNATTWSLQENVIRGLKVVGNFDPWDLVNFKVVSPPARLETIVQEVNDDEFRDLDGIKIINSYSVIKAVLDNPKFLASFVVDGSGSSGWNDRFGSRMDFINQFITKLKNYYPSDYLIDITRFGSIQLDTDSLYPDIGTPATINLDLFTPTRTTYKFVVNPASAIKGAVYSNNSCTFVVLETITGGTSLLCLGTGDPTDAGELAKQSGTGDAIISFTEDPTTDEAYTKASVLDSIVGYGFKNFAPEKSDYNICDITIGDNAFGSVTEKVNWHTFFKGGYIDVNIGLNGPKNTDSLDVNGYSPLVLRKSYSTSIEALPYSPISIDVVKGATTVKVNDVSVFKTGDIVDLIDGSFVSLGHTISVIDVPNNTITLDFGANFNIASWAIDNGIVQISTLSRAIVVNGTTAKLLVRQAATDNVVNVLTFFLQTVDGYSIEWDFYPHPEWYIYNLFWIDETAKLPVTIKDKDGNWIADGTKVFFYVNEIPKDAVKQDQVDSVLLTASLASGGTRAYVESIDGYAKDQSISIVDKINQTQSFILTEVGEEGSLFYMDLDSASGFNFTVGNISRVVLNDRSQEDLTGQISSKTQLSSFLSLVDVTPKAANRNLDSSFNLDYDPPPILPTTTYASLNTDRVRVRQQTTNVLSIDGLADVRVLPVTEDNLKTIVEKEQESARNLRLYGPQTYLKQLEENEGDVEEVDQEIIGNVTTTTTTVAVSTLDYDIESPVYTIQGTATGSMDVRPNTSTSLTPILFDGLNLPTKTLDTSMFLLAKKYDVYPCVVIEDSNHVIKAMQFLSPFETYFASPININSTCDGQKVKYYLPSFSCPQEAPDKYEPPIEETYAIVEMNGVYAGSGKDFVIEYVITNELLLLSSGQINIRIYSNTKINLENVVRDLNFVPSTDPAVEMYRPPLPSQEQLNVIFPSTTTTVNGVATTTQPVTDIDAWRNEVAQNTIATNSTVEPGTYFEYYTNPNEWLLVAQYENIVIEDGKASITIPASEVSSLLMVQASYVFGDNQQYETIRSDLVFVASPINVNLVQGVKPKDSDPQSALIANVTWEENPIDLNTACECLPSPSSTAMNCVEARVINTSGDAEGIIFGPHDPVIMVEKICGADTVMAGEIEKIKLVVSYGGYTNTVERLIEWTGVNKSKEKDSKDPVFAYPFLAKINGDGINNPIDPSYNPPNKMLNTWYEPSDVIEARWADGGDLDRISCDLDTDNIARSDGWIGSLGIEKLKGFDQPDGLPNETKDYYVRHGIPPDVSKGEKLWKWGGVNNVKITSDRKERWGGSESYSDNDGEVQLSLQALNENIGWDPKLYGVFLNSQYFDGQNVSKCISVGAPPELVGVIDEFGDIIYHWRYQVPCLNYSEPLAITVEVEELNNVFIRDGVSTATIVADVTWEGNYLNGKLPDNALIDYPFPSVIFKVGTCQTPNFEVRETGPDIWHDKRNQQSGCFIVAANNDVKLDQYTAVVSLSRTSVYTLNGNSHTHVCSVDSDGNGVTTSVKILSGMVSYHTHSISNYSVAGSHYHTLRSVAVVELQPTKNTDIDITVNAYVNYDPTNCNPYTPRTATDLVLTGNRIMFSTLTIPRLRTRKLLSGIGIGKDYVDALASANSMISFKECVATGGVCKTNPPPLLWAAENPTDTDKGFDILFKSKFTAYDVYDPVSGKYITIPEAPLEDGTPIQFEVRSFSALSALDGDDIFVVRPDKVRNYMIIRVIVTVYYDDGLFYEDSIMALICSNLAWLPNVKSLLTEPTKDTTYLTDAISKVNSMGASQIHDAVKLAAQNIIQYQTDNPLWKDAKKTIFLLTDGDENTSENSINQAISNVKFIDGTYETPVIPIRFGFTENSDEILLRKYAVETGGSLKNMIDSDSTDVSLLIDEIVTDVNGSIGISYGTYTNIIDLGSDNLPSKLNLSNVVLPTGSKIIIRARISSDRENWSVWSSWMDVSKNIDFLLDLSSKGRYFEYQVKLFASPDFVSPELFSGATLDYYKAQNFAIFFQPISMDINSTDFVSSIHITHAANIPATSIVNYGFVQKDSVDFNDYFSTTRPLIVPDRHTILLDRQDEMLLTDDFQTYKPINGRWPQDSEIEVYRVNPLIPSGILIDPETYIVNSNEGNIKFYNIQNSSDIFVICISMDPVFRIVCNIVNYGPVGGIIDHIGILYNTTTRIPKDSLGNIIHIPVSEII